MVTLPYTQKLELTVDRLKYRIDGGTKLPPGELKSVPQVGLATGRSIVGGRIGLLLLEVQGIDIVAVAYPSQLDSLFRS